MLLVGFKPGHDGTVTAVKDRKLLYSLEGEKDSFPRHAFLTSSNVLDMAELLGELPDVVAHGGWDKHAQLGYPHVATGYNGTGRLEQRASRFFGKPVTFYSSSHERSHLLMSVGMAPRDDAQERAILIWEGAIGAFHLLDERFEVKDRVKVMELPGFRYSFLYGLADPAFAGAPQWPRDEDAGKLMALAAFADAGDADQAISSTVDRILEAPTVLPAPKDDFHDTPVYNAGVEAEETKIAAALLTQRIFDRFAAAAHERLPDGMPLHISGGCGLNCDWNRQWRDMGHFSSGLRPAVHERRRLGARHGHRRAGRPHRRPVHRLERLLRPGVRVGTEPDPAVWQRRSLDMRQIAVRWRAGEIVAWVQGRWEMGPRALGNRSLLAEPSSADARSPERDQAARGLPADRPVCRVEDLAKAFDTTIEDPYMLYFRRVPRRIWAPSPTSTEPRAARR